MAIVALLRPVTSDRGMAQAFLDILDPDDKDFSFVALSDNKGDERSARICRGTLRECWDNLAKWNDDRRSICVAVNQIKK